MSVDSNNIGKCPYCGSEVVLKDADYVYHSKKAKDYPKVWVCSNYPECDAYVGCHKGTDVPMGRLANLRLRTLKIEAHKQFDVIWKSRAMTRRTAYYWLAKHLGINIKDCHIGMFDIKECQRVIHLCKSFRCKRVDDYRKEHHINKGILTRGYKTKNNK